MDCVHGGVALTYSVGAALRLQWIKGPSNATCNGEPCSFPGKVWKSSVGDRFNMLCSPHWTGNWGSVWARYESTDPDLLTWTLADANISNFMPSQHNNAPYVYKEC